ncbi:MAG: hypothetical protein PUB29_02255 [Bacteroidales bacterium]|nr:hypothetical protein [Bacteroidales bacterium]
MNLLVFNPEHDYALADNQPQFVALRSAAQFAHDCAPFMRYLTEDETVVLDAYRPFGKEFQKNFAPLENADHITKVTPWGWNAAVVYQLQRIGVPDKLLPTDEQLSKLRALAHRKTTIEAMEFLRGHCAQPEKLPETPEYLTDILEIEDFVQRMKDVIFKSPYSGNGRGHLYAHGECSPTLLRQCGGVLKRQGGILAEKQYTVVQDFAMEFECRNGEVIFQGYSLFKTEHYGYGGNLLMPDSEILRTLSRYVDTEELAAVQSLVSDFLQKEIAPHYEGDAGVDMFVYQEDGTYKIHPFVEVNLRKTMGLAAHDIYARYCHPEARGTFRIVRGEVETRHGTSLQSGMQLRDGLWWSGTIALSPVTAATRYAVVMELNDSN